MPRLSFAALGFKDHLSLAANSTEICAPVMPKVVYTLQFSILVRGENGLYTKNGKPLQVSGNTVYSCSGKVVGRIKGKKVYGTDGRYVGTIVNDRLVYRSTDSAGVGSSFSPANRAGTAKANRAGSAIWGQEPDIPD